MIQPIRSESAHNSAALLEELRYKIATWDDDLPAFDPTRMVKTVLLSTDNVKRFNRFVINYSRLIGPTGTMGVLLRCLAFVSPAPVGRVLAPIAAIVQTPGSLYSAAQMRTQYVQIVMRTFDFWFLQASNTVWAITFSFVLRDSRVVLVVGTWANTTLWILQETFLTHASFVLWGALLEWLFFVLLTIAFFLDLVDNVDHIDLLSNTLSTRDILVNVMATMATLSTRNVYRRYVHTKWKKERSGSAMKALGYRCKIALHPVQASSSARSSILPRVSNAIKPSETKSVDRERRLLQMRLAPEKLIKAGDTVWPNIGAQSPISTWKSILLEVCGQAAGGFAVLALLLPRIWPHSLFADAIPVMSVVTAIIYTTVLTCCYQRQLLKRLLTSFHFVFLALQIVLINVSIYDIFNRHWSAGCSGVAGTLLGYSILAIDALTPSMKRRLRFKFWIAVEGIIVSSLVYSLLAVDVLMTGVLHLQDRVFLDYTVFGQQTQFQVGPFLLSRLITLFVWSGRYVYVAVTRKNDGALILLRGDVEFDYEGWKKQVMPGRRPEGM